MTDRTYFGLYLIISWTVVYFSFVFIFNSLMGLKGSDRFNFRKFEESHPKLEILARWIGVVFYLPFGLYFFG